MIINFNDKANKALGELIASKENGVIRLEVLAFGWGTPALGLVLDKQKVDDFFITVEDISFVIEKKVKIYFESTEILYNPEVFNKGFYVHRYRTPSL